MGLAGVRDGRASPLARRFCRRAERRTSYAPAVAHQVGDVARAVDEIGARWRADRKDRQARRHLDAADFDRLRDAGLLRLIVPVDSGGSWVDMPSSAPPAVAIYRRLAAADPSVALVSSMHPAVIAFWLASPDPAQPAWEEQRRAVFASAAAGEQWGTITSEPGSGGDIARTRATAAPIDGRAVLPGRTYAVTGDKHFGSGFGVTDRMITTAVPEGEADPTIFVLDVRDRPWDGSAGLRADRRVGRHGDGGHPEPRHAPGRALPRCGWPGTAAARPDHPGRRAVSSPRSSPPWSSASLDEADRRRPRPGARARPTELRAYEQVEWARAEQDHWVAVQAYEGALRAVEGGRPDVAVHDALRAKEAVADLAEQHAAAPHPGPRRRHVLAALAVRPLVRGRPRPRLPAAAVGPRLRHPVRDVARVAGYVRPHADPIRGVRR